VLGVVARAVHQAREKKNDFYVNFTFQQKFGGAEDLQQTLQGHKK